jgi:hypothetical protein
MSQTSKMTTAELNDRFRQHNLGFGRVVVAPMVEMMPIEQREALMLAVESRSNMRSGFH